MGAIRMLARSELRRRWRSVVLLTLLVGVGGAVVLALTAGARRTSTALDRFDAYSRAADLEISVGSPTAAKLREFAATHGVAGIGRVHQIALLEKRSDQFLAVAAQADHKFGREVDRPIVVRGRLADQHSTDEVVIGEDLADRLGLDVGDALHFESYTPDQIQRALRGEDTLRQTLGPLVTLRVVGIVRRPLDLGGRGAAGGVIVPTRAFLAKYGDQIGSFGGDILRVRLDDGHDLARVTAAARRIFGDTPVFQVVSLGIEGKGAENAIHVTTTALVIAAVLAGAVTLVGVSLALAREVSLVDVDQFTLRALGLRAPHRAFAAAAVAIPVATVGALIAAAGSIALSPLFPIGVARKAEVDPGVRFDALVVVSGFLAVAGVVLAVGAISGLRTARAGVAMPGIRRAASARTSNVLASVPPPAAIGVGFALDRGPDNRAVPVRSSLVGAVLGVVVVVAVAVFGTSLDHLVSTPAAYGTTWDYVASDGKAVSDDINCGHVKTRLTSVRGISDVTSICSVELQIGGRPVEGSGYTDLRGHIGPQIVRGRAPRTATEVVLGAETMRALDKDIGDTVMVRGGRGPFRYRIVGQTTFAALGDPVPLADGAAFTGPGAARVDTANGANDNWSTVVRFRPGVSSAVAERRLAVVALPGTPAQGAQLPAEIDRVHQIDDLPVALAAFVSAVAIVAVGLVLVSSVRRRRRELAVLTTLGFVRRQVRATIAWHATTVAALALLVGIPLGLVLGRFVWRSVADELGVSTDPTWPVLAVVLLVPAAVLVVNLVAAVPAARAARTRPAVVLRSE